MSDNQTKKSTKAYLGDGVYVEDLGHQLKLTAENGIRATDTIYLDGEVLRGLVGYAERRGHKA